MPSETLKFEYKGESPDNYTPEELEALGTDYLIKSLILKMGDRGKIEDFMKFSKEGDIIKIFSKDNPQLEKKFFGTTTFTTLPTEDITITCAGKKARENREPNFGVLMGYIKEVSFKQSENEYNGEIYTAYDQKEGIGLRMNKNFKIILPESSLILGIKKDSILRYNLKEIIEKELNLSKKKSLGNLTDYNGGRIYYSLDNKFNTSLAIGINWDIKRKKVSYSSELIFNDKNREKKLEPYMSGSDAGSRYTSFIKRTKQLLDLEKRLS